MSDLKPRLGDVYKCTPVRNNLGFFTLVNFSNDKWEVLWQDGVYTALHVAMLNSFIDGNHVTLWVRL